MTARRASASFSTSDGTRALAVGRVWPGVSAAFKAVASPRVRNVATIFSECQTWLMGSNVTQWLTALDRIAALGVDWVIPGHGEVVGIEYISRQRANLLEWVQAVSDAVAQGWSEEETITRVSFAERYPVDIGQGHMMNHIQTHNAESLWEKLTHARPA